MSKRSGTSTIVGLLACQADSYLKSLKTTVVACQPGTKGYEVEFQDTVLFPEGGGQPNDQGYVKVLETEESIDVFDVQRDGLTAVHHLEKPVTEGAEIEMHVNWKRRLDNMQQHSGQHLLSAILDKRKLETLCWGMGTKFPYVEIPRKLTPEEVQEVQQEVNDVIKQAIDIHVEHPDEIKTEHTIPDNYDLGKGVFRVVCIGDLDYNPCCGTHLRNTSEIGSLTILHSQSMRGTNSRMFFLAGDRVHRYAAEANSVIRTVNSALSCQTDDIEEKLSKLQLQLKEASVRERKIAEQLVKFEVEKMKADLEKNKVSILYKPEGDNNYFKIVEKELGKNFSGTVLYYTGEPKQTGSIVVSGAEVDKYVEKIKNIVPEIKGGGKGKWQGKVVSWDKAALEGVSEIVVN